MSTFIYPPLQATISGVATEATLLDVLAEVTDINSNTVDAATATKQDEQTTVLNSIDAKDFATDATLSGLSTKVITADTDNVTVISSALPSGAATEATLNNIFVDIDNALSAGTQGDTNAVYVDYTSTNLPGNASSPLEIISAVSVDTYWIHPFDTSGAPCELMAGGAGDESRFAVIGPGVDAQIKVNIGAGTRVSIRRLDSASALAVGNLCINFIGI